MKSNPIRRLISGVIFIGLGIHTYLTNFGNMKNVAIVFVGYGIFSLGLGIWWLIRKKEEVPAEDQSQK